MTIYRIRAPTLILAATLLLFPPSCTGGGPPEGTSGAISRETFIQAYVRLRKAALTSPGEELDIAERDQILKSLGVESQDLLTFVDIWGRDGEMMQGIWQDVDSLLRESRTDEEGPPLDDEGRG